MSHFMEVDSVSGTISGEGGSGLGPTFNGKMTEIVADHPDFAPAHGSLAEIYASVAFHDE
jgi:hypothetical protein